MRKKITDKERLDSFFRRERGMLCDYETGREAIDAAILAGKR